MAKVRNPLDCGCTVSRGGELVRLPDQLCPRFLTGLPEAQLNSVLSAAKHRRFAASSVIVHQGDPAERFFLLTSGHGRHFVITPKGKKISLHWLTCGQLIGGAALLVPRITYLASTELLSNGCALVWDRKTIRDLVRRCPELLDNALSIAVTEHLAWILASHVSLTSDNATGRVAHFLLSLASGVGVVDRCGIELQIKNEDLAAGASVTPFTASRVLSRWQRAGVLTKRRGKLLLRKPELLLVSR
jgi:CRP-like cAMP-binding protein